MAVVQQTSTTRRRQAVAKGQSVDQAGRLGPWQPDKLLGEGTLARVYSARHESSRPAADASYAIKVLRPKWYERSEVIDILRREALIGSRVQHENVVAVLDARLHAPPYYLVMPRLMGHTVEAALCERMTFPPAEALWITRQVAEGLHAIQSACGAPHGDVKPSNVFLSPHGRATLLDMGFGRPFSHGHSTTGDTRPTLCSLAYAAPETVTTSAAGDFRSDIYSLGVMLYQMLSGCLPHDAVDWEALVEMLQTERPPCLRRLRPDLPEPVAALVHAMLSKNPARRPGAYAQLVDGLVRLEIGCYCPR